MASSSRLLPLSLLWLWGWAFLGFLPGALAYPSGAPSSACTSMNPSHGASATSGTKPYTLTTNSSTYSPKERIAVTISGNNVLVRGFMLQARPDSDRTSGTKVGSFIADSDTKTVCSNGGASTHKRRLSLSSVTVTWEAPSSSQGNIVFRATVVKQKTVYYTAIYSSTISSSQSTTTTTTTPASTNTTTTAASTTTTTTTTPAFTTTTTTPASTTTTTSPPTTGTTTTSQSTITTTPPSSTAINQTASASSTATTTEDERNTRPVG